jgi:hypothetical protein
MNALKNLWYITKVNILSFTLLSGFILTGTAQTLVDETFEDFIRGTLDASGANIYVSRDGKIRTIHRYDYNDDGYIDLLFPHTHDQTDDLPSTLAEVMADRSIKELKLAYKGSLQVTSADLNLDGYNDLIFIPNHDGIQNPRNFLTIVYGGEDGWPASRSTAPLPVNGARAVAVADLNRDGWPDIVTLNSEAWNPGQPPGNIIRIYWGGERGYLNTRFLDIGIPEATAISSGDFDGNGYGDIAILRKDSTLTILWSTLLKEGAAAIETSDIDFPAGRTGLTIAAGDVNNNHKTDLVVGTGNGLIYIIPSPGSRLWGNNIQEIKAYRASNISIGDIDSDGHNDIVLSYFEQRIGPAGEYGGAADETSGRAAHILWGGNDGFSGDNSTSLDALNISATAIGDFDGDGYKDLAVAINRGTTDFATRSVIYYGKGERQFVRGDSGINTSGTIYAHSVRPGEGKSDRVIFCNSKGGTVGERVPAYIYWGGPEGFRENNVTEIPMRSGYEATVADLNANGFTDIVLLNQMHHGQKDDPFAGANIMWGNADGYDFSEEGRTVLNEFFLGSSNVADLNRDGYLDIVLGSYESGDFESSVIIYYGGPGGFTRENRKAIPCPGRSLGIQLADYDKDGWLDIAVNSYNEVGVRIFFGGEDGFDYKRQVQLDAPSVADLKTADLNGDGWLDLIVCSYNDIANNRQFDMGTYIFWGGPEGFNHANSQWLPGFAALGPVVADFDNDGHLDLFLPHYHGVYTRDQIPSYLYWGSKEGFNIYDRTEIINNSAAQAFAADFNKNGKLDLAVSNHTYRGSHITYSKIFYNDGDRFNNPRVEKLPTRGPHWSQNVDMGHIYDRSWRQTYESSVFKWDKKRGGGILEFVADIPEGTRVIFEIRSAAKSSGLHEAQWIEIGDPGRFKTDPKDRFLQYRAVFLSDNGDRFPILEKVVVNLIN